MLTFYGKNDKSTLEDVLLEVEKELRYANIGLKNGRTRRDRDRYDGMRIALELMQWRLQRAIESGPYRDISKLRITIPEDSLRKLQES